MIKSKTKEEEKKTAAAKEESDDAVDDWDAVSDDEIIGKMKDKDIRIDDKEEDEVVVKAKLKSGSNPKGLKKGGKKGNDDEKDEVDIFNRADDAKSKD